MNKEIKYIIYFLIGLIINYLLFNDNNLIEGLNSCANTDMFVWGLSNTVGFGCTNTDHCTDDGVFTYESCKATHVRAQDSEPTPALAAAGGTGNLLLNPYHATITEYTPPMSRMNIGSDEIKYTGLPIKRQKVSIKENLHCLEDEKFRVITGENGGVNTEKSTLTGDALVAAGRHCREGYKYWVTVQKGSDKYKADACANASDCLDYTDDTDGIPSYCVDCPEYTNWLSSSQNEDEDYTRIQTGYDRYVYPGTQYLAKKCNLQPTGGSYNREELYEARACSLQLCSASKFSDNEGCDAKPGNVVCAGAACTESECCNAAIDDAVTEANSDETQSCSDSLFWFGEAGCAVGADWRDGAEADLGRSDRAWGSDAKSDGPCAGDKCTHSECCVSASGAAAGVGGASVEAPDPHAAGGSASGAAAGVGGASVEGAGTSVPAPPAAGTQACSDSPFSNDAGCVAGADDDLNVANSEGTCSTTACTQAECCSKPVITGMCEGNTVVGDVTCTDGKINKGPTATGTDEASCCETACTADVCTAVNGYTTKTDFATIVGTDTTACCDEAPATSTCATDFTESNCSGTLSEYNASGNCSGTECTNEECCKEEEDNTMIIIIVVIGIIFCCILPLLWVILK